MSDTSNVLNWTVDDVIVHLKNDQILACESEFLHLIIDDRIDGKSLLALNETDIRDFKLKYSLRLGAIKHFSIVVRQLQKQNHTNLVNLGLLETTALGTNYMNQQQHCHINHSHHANNQHHHHHHCSYCSDISNFHDMERISPPLSVDGRATSIKPEIFKTMISLGKCKKSNNLRQNNFDKLLPWL